MSETQLDKLDLTQRIIESLSNACMRAVLFCVKVEAKDANSIADELGMSRSTVYKTVSALEELTLLDIERFVISKEGKKSKLYRSRIAKAEITIQGSEPALRLYPVE